MSRVFSFLPALLGCATGVEPGIAAERAIARHCHWRRRFWWRYGEISDWVNTKTLVIAGTNLLETSMMQANTFMDAKEAGCEIYRA